MTGPKRTISFWATCLTLLGVIILCGLGTWQLQRLAWKEKILAELDTIYNQDATLLTEADITDNNKYLYGKIKGTFLFNKAILMGHAIREERQGKFLIVPIKAGNTTWLANLGWNDNETTLGNHPLKIHDGRTITLTGLARPPFWNAFTPQNDPENNVWYRPDVKQIADVKLIDNPSPLIFYPSTTTPELNAGFPNNETWKPNNNHAQYAFFWFTLAAAMVIIYLLRFVVKSRLS